MELLTVTGLREERKTLPAAQSGELAPVRRAIGVRLYDVTLLCAPRTPLSRGERANEAIGSEQAETIAALMRRSGLVADVSYLPGDECPAPDARFTARLADSRAALLVIPERGEVGGAWLAWTLGWITARGVKGAAVPVAARDPWREPSRFAPLARPMLAPLPVVGVARAVGEEAPSLWVVPPGARLDARDAVNFEFWLRERNWKW